ARSRRRLPPVPVGRAHPAQRRVRARRALRVDARHLAGGPRARGAGGRRVRARRRSGRALRGGHGDRRRRGRGRRSAQPALGPHPRERARAAAPLRRGGRRRPRLRRGAPRAARGHGRGSRVRLPAAGDGVGRGARSRPHRALCRAPRDVPRALRRRPRALRRPSVSTGGGVMSEPFFPNIDRIRYRGPETDEPLAYRFYDPDRLVLGKRMADQLRIAVCWWHTLCWPGTDMFGSETFDRPWLGAGEPEALARRKAEVAFELFEKLGVPFFTFHDRDVSPEVGSLRETNDAFARLLDVLADGMERTGVRLLWGTANLFGHRRYAAGAATNPDPEVFAYAAAQVKAALEGTHRLGGENYVLWGGREGYDTLLNTDLRRELDHLGRFLALVVEHKHRIGFAGTLLVEPKPMEPTKQQYDH